MKGSVYILIALVVLFAAALVVLSRHEGRYRRALEAYKRELLAKGEKLTMAELSPPPTNDPELGRKLTYSMANYAMPNNLPAMMKTVAPGVAAVGHTNLAPEPAPGYAQNVSKVEELREVLGTNVLGFNFSLTL